MKLILMALAVFQYEINDGNQVKQCVYDLEGDRYVITISINRQCPQTIRI